MTALLSQWANSLDLSREVSNPDRDFSSGLFHIPHKRIVLSPSSVRFRDCYLVLVGRLVNGFNLHVWHPLCVTYPGLLFAEVLQKFDEDVTISTISQKASSKVKILLPSPTFKVKNQRFGDMFMTIECTGIYIKTPRWISKLSMPCTKRMLQTNLTNFSGHKFKQERRNK